MYQRAICALMMALSMIFAAGCDKKEVRTNAQLQVLQLGAPKTDRDRATVALLEGRLAMDMAGGSDAVYDNLVKRYGDLSEMVGITPPADKAAIGPAIEGSKWFDKRGDYIDDSLRLTGMCHSIHLASENVWSRYEKRWF